MIRIGVLLSPLLLFLLGCALEYRHYTIKRRRVQARRAARIKNIQNR